MSPHTTRSATLLAGVVGVLAGAAVGVALGLLLHSVWIGVVAGVVLAILVALSLRRWWLTGGSARADTTGPAGVGRPATSLGGGLPGSVGPAVEMPPAPGTDRPSH